MRQFLANENPLKMMENAFYFILKAVNKLIHLANKLNQMLFISS